MAFDGIVTKCVVSELQQNIINAKINKVFEPSSDTIVIGLYCNGKNLALNMSIHPQNARIHLTTYTKPNPISAPNFCMLLRKHLIGGKIINIITYDLERLVELHIECYNEMKDKIIKKLFIQIMSTHSNIILTNEKNIIIDALKHVCSTQCEILPTHFFSLPSTNKINLLNLHTFSKFIEILNTNSKFEPIDKKISDAFLGISRPFIQNICSTLNIDIQKTTIEDLQKIFLEIRNILDNIGTKNLSLQQIHSNNDFIVTYGTHKDEPYYFNFFIDDFYYHKEQVEALKNYKNSLLKSISSTLTKYTKKLYNINAKLEECNIMDKYRLYGELLTSYLYMLKDKVSFAVVKNYYDNNNEITIPLDSTISPNKNAEKYFKKYNKLKNTLKIVTLQQKECKEELKYIESLIYSIENCKTIEELKEIEDEMHSSFLSSKLPSKKSIKEKKFDADTLLSYEIDDFKIYIGKNNRQNDYLTFKIAHYTDIWFHVKDAHGSHVILKTNKKEVPYNILIQCAKYAVAHSKSKNSSNVAVDYCLVKYVKKPSGSKPGMVIYTNYKTLYV